MCLNVWLFENFSQSTSVCTSSTFSTLWRRVGALKVLGGQMCSATYNTASSLQPHTLSHAHTHRNTHTDPCCDCRPSRPLAGPAQPTQTLWSLWSGEKPELGWICPCKYIPFPLTKHHRMSKSQEPHSAGLKWPQNSPPGSFVLPGAFWISHCSPNTRWMDSQHILGGICEENGLENR